MSVRTCLVAVKEVFLRQQHLVILLGSLEALRVQQNLDGQLVCRRSRGLGGAAGAHLRPECWGDKEVRTQPCEYDRDVDVAAEGGALTSRPSRCLDSPLAGTAASALRRRGWRSDGWAPKKITSQLKNVSRFSEVEVFPLVVFTEIFRF